MTGGSEMGIHDGHRERLRARFLEHGLLTFNEIEALELLLFYAIPQRDTNPLAHALLDHFGSLNDLFHASEQELCEVPGVGTKTAALLMLVPQMTRLSGVKQSQRIGDIRGAKDAQLFLRPYYEGLQDEMLMLVCMDSMKKVISAEVLNRGVVDSVRFDIRLLVEVALKRKSSWVVMAHNHPDGQAYPSREDDSVTASVCRALRALGIELFDHVIFAGENCYSYRDKGALDVLGYR